MSDAQNIGSPRPLARLTGCAYLFIMAAAMFAEAFVRDRLIVSGDAATTVRNIAANDTLWRWGIAADVSTTLADIAVSALLYLLLKPVSRSLSLSAAFFRLAYSAAMAAGAAFLIAPLQLIHHAPQGPSPTEVEALTSFTLRLHDAGFAVALTLFGVHLMIVGGLIARSTFLPRLLGLALAFAGLCYVTNSFLRILSPPLADALFPWILLPGFFAEGTLAVWLIFGGVNSLRWLAVAGEQVDTEPHH
jgi:uncharacterized membrane protein